MKPPITFRGRNFVGGHWVTAHGERLESISPGDETVVWSGQSSTLEDVDAAILAAAGAAKDWADLPLTRRAEVAGEFARQLEQHLDELAQLICMEVGKPFWEAKTEVQAMIGKIPVSLDALKQRRSPTSIDLGASRGSVQYRPHGVLCVFGPFNFPGHISNGHIVPALMAGNTVVFKPSELTPLVAEKMTELWEQAGLPSGVLNLVQGGRETGCALVDHPGHRGVLFTGSLAVGVSISRALVDRPECIVALELGGNNPLVVDQVSDIDAAVLTTIQSAFLTSGQRCTCARRLIVPDGNDAFVERLRETVPLIRVGRPDEDPPPMMGPLIHKLAVQKVLAEQQRLLAAGGSVLVEARLLSDLGNAYVSPGLIDVTNVQDRQDEELFGPLLQLIRVPDFEAAIQAANATQYGLVAGLLTDRREYYERFSRELNSGLINWNCPTTGASGQLPFGGTGRSGNHRPAGYFTVDFCNVPIASLARETLHLPEQLPPGISFPEQTDA